MDSRYIPGEPDSGQHVRSGGQEFPWAEPVRERERSRDHEQDGATAEPAIAREQDRPPAALGREDRPSVLDEPQDFRTLFANAHDAVLSRRLSGRAGLADHRSEPA